MKIIVTCGGQGTKLWPYSRQHQPKQFQPIIGTSSSYQESINTLLGAFAPEDIFISTKHRFIKYISEQSPQIPLRNYIVEPDAPKDRGPGEGLAFLRLDMLHPDEPFFLVQADCIREPEDEFIRTIKAAEKLVKEQKCFVTGGIKATEPTMGVDYLTLGDKIKGSDVESYVIKEFVDRRPTMRQAKELVENFHVVTHCNHACWYPGLMLEAYKRYRPDWHEALMKIKDVLDKPGEQEAIRQIYEEMEKGPTEDVTRQVMSSGEAVALLLPFKWTDVGTWGSVHEFAADEANNHFDARVVAVDSKGTLVKAKNRDKLFALAGVKDMVIIDSDDVLLVIPREDIDKIKQIQAELASQGSELL